MIGLIIFFLFAAIGVALAYLGYSAKKYYPHKPNLILIAGGGITVLLGLLIAASIPMIGSQPSDAGDDSLVISSSGYEPNPDWVGFYAEQATPSEKCGELYCTTIKIVSVTKGELEETEVLIKTGSSLDFPEGTLFHAEGKKQAGFILVDYESIYTDGPM